MATKRFGDLEIDVPEGWTDFSLVTLVSEPIRRGIGSGIQDFRRNFIISRARADETFTVADLAAKHIEKLRPMLPSIEVLEESEIEIDGAIACYREVRFQTPSQGLAQQAHLFVSRGPWVFTMVGTGSAGLVFQSFKKDILHIAKSFVFRGETA